MCISNLLRIAPLWFATLAAALAGGESDGVKRAFDLPADAAERSIRRFAEQSGLEVFYPSSATKGVRTPAVKGEMTASEALDAMLAGTDLTVVRVGESGAFSLRRASPGSSRSGPAAARGATSSSAPRKLAPPHPANSSALVNPLDSIVVLSPFEVVTQNRGYYAANTMSGTRLNSKLEDLGASISVVTKEQIENFCLLDLNDIFNYEAGTEGTGNYTDFYFNRNFEPVSNTELSPHTANRIRGLATANTTWGNFETSGRVPIDPLNVDAVEISRGPNAAIFGIGSPSGTVNSVPATARLNRDWSQVSFRGDTSGGHRSTVDLNRVLKSDVLAIRGSVAYQHDGFELKPSGLDTTRLNGMARYRPFSRTTFTASYGTYRMHGNHPNVTLPRETITGWIAAGEPTWDPIARTVKKNGAVVATYPQSVPSMFTNAPHDVFTNFFVDPGGTTYAGAGRHTSTRDPNEAAPGGSFLVNILGDPPGVRTKQPLYAHIPTAVDQRLYDWSSVNLAAPNRLKDEAAMANVMWDQVVFDTPRHLLALQAGWFREQVDGYRHHPVGAPSNVSTVAALHIDVNERLLDGTPNPHFLRLFYGSTNPYHTFDSSDRDTYRGQVAYKLDLRNEPGWRQWLGMHHISGYGEYKEGVSRKAFYYPAVVDHHSWLGAGVPAAGRGQAIGGMSLPGPKIALGYFRYYVGDAAGANVDFAPGSFAPGRYPMVFGNVADGFHTEDITIGLASYAAGGSFNQRTIVKSRGAILQSHFFRDRVVTTFGVRGDRRYGRSGGPFQLQPDGVNIDHAVTDRWSDGGWNVGEGPTRTTGIILKPTRWLSLHANRSDSFQPEPVHQDVYLKLLADPTGKGEDYGLRLNLMNGKLFVNINQYKVLSLDRRGGTIEDLANRARNIDFVYDYSLQKKAESWFQAEAASRGAALSPQALSVKVADLMRLPQRFLSPLDHHVNTVEDIKARGTEIELHYDPTNFWTVKANFTRQEASATNISPEINRWITERTRVWESIIDPTIGRPWFTEPYSPYLGGQSPKDYLNVFVIAPLKLAQALEGKSLPQIRKYRANLSTRFRLAGMTDHVVLKRFNIGGAVRWESRGNLGYRGVQQPPDIVTAFDSSRPILDRAHLSLDAFLSYRGPFLGEVTANWQLNVRNLTERGRLQPIAADPDATPSAYRIVPPRQFILSVTFDL